ncbi:MAG: hypothetical protein R3Y64_09915 [Peptostreptococcaceae bacterium]
MLDSFKKYILNKLNTENNEVKVLSYMVYITSCNCKHVSIEELFSKFETQCSVIPYGFKKTYKQISTCLMSSNKHEVYKDIILSMNDSTFFIVENGMIKSFIENEVLNSYLLLLKYEFSNIVKKYTPILKTEMDILEKKIEEQFNQVKFLGLVKLSYEEDLFIETYAISILKKVLLKKVKIGIDFMYCYWLVKVGVNYYDGNYWEHIKHLSKLDVNGKSSIIANSIINLNKKYYSNIKYLEGRFVDNILLHSFVVDHYIYRFFDFLNKFYTNDIERDINRLDDNLLEYLYDNIIKNDNKNGTYGLNKHLSDAFIVEKDYSIFLLKKLFINIDKHFWCEETDKYSDRIFSHLKTWQIKEKIKKVNELSRNQSKSDLIRNSIPRISFLNHKFYLSVPTILFKNNKLESSGYYVIKYDDQEFKYSISFVEASIGSKVLSEKLELKSSKIFNSIKVSLCYLDGSIIKDVIDIKKENHRFINTDYNFVNLNNDYINFTNIKYMIAEDKGVIKTTGEVSTINMDDYVLCQLNISKNDITYINNILCFDKSPKSSLSTGGLIKGCSSIEMKNVYNEVPSLLAIFNNESQINGTSLTINNVKYKILDLTQKTIFPDFKIAIKIELSDYIKGNGQYTVDIDIPNHSKLNFDFIYIKKFEFLFSSEFYIFQNKCNISFPTYLNVNSKYESERIDFRTFYSVEIPRSGSLEFVVEGMNVIINVPVLLWSFDGDNWYIEEESCIWHEDLPNYLFFKLPSSNIKLSLDDSKHPGAANEFESFTFNKTLQMFKCDITRFRSWLKKEYEERQLFVNINDVKYKFLDIITTSIAINAELRIDKISNKTIIDFDIVGKGNYIFDISLNGNIVNHDTCLLDNKFEFNEILPNGVYDIVVYELEEDFFGNKSKVLLNSFKSRILNPINLIGEKFLINGFKRNSMSRLSQRLSCTYICTVKNKINNDDKLYVIEIVVQKNDVFKAKMYGSIELLNVNDLVNVMLKVFISDYGDDDEDEYGFFIYDNKYRTLLRDEEVVSRKERYERFDDLHDVQSFQIKFIN